MGSSFREALDRLEVADMALTEVAIQIEAELPDEPDEELRRRELEALRTVAEAAHFVLEPARAALDFPELSMAHGESEVLYRLRRERWKVSAAPWAVVPEGAPADAYPKEFFELARFVRIT